MPLIFLKMRNENKDNSVWLCFFGFALSNKQNRLTITRTFSFEKLNKKKKSKRLTYML